MDNFSNPAKNIESMVIGEGSVVADFGSGSGFYSIAAARVVGEEGSVYAVDIQKELLERLKTEAEKERLPQIEIVWGDIEIKNGSKLDSGVADIVLLCNTLFQLSDKAGAIAEALRVLRPNGRICVIDWTDAHLGMGPDQSLVVDADAARELFEIDFEFEKEFDAGDHHYGLLFRKK